MPLTALRFEVESIDVQPRNIVESRRYVCVYVFLPALQYVHMVCMVWDMRARQLTCIASRKALRRCVNGTDSHSTWRGM
jgi:hypothetical protein